MGKGEFSGNTDYHLWERFKEGDKRAMEKIFYDHYSSLYNYGMRLCNDASLVEDSIQELFVELISKLGSLGPTDHIDFYLLASLRRKVFAKLKNNTTYNYADQEDLMPVDDQESSPEEEWIDREADHNNSRKIRGLISSLPEREREAIYLKYFRNLSYRQITEIMGVNYKSARMLVYRALTSLREQCQEAFRDF